MAPISCPKCNLDRKKDSKGKFRCLNCARIRVAKLRGSKSLDEQTYPAMVKGRRSERAVETYLNSKGHTNVIVLGGPNAPDITFVEFGRTVKVEVKTVIRNRSYNGWYVDRVSPNRRGDDYIAFVFPDGSIQMEPMNDHLLKVGSSGRRNVSSTVLGWHPDQTINPKFRARNAIITILRARGEWPSEVA